MKRMKGLKLLLFSILMMIPFGVVYAGSVSVSKSSMSVSVGDSGSFKITANSAAGRVDIKSSDTSVATVSASSKFLDNSSASITVKGKKEGTATITIKFTDVAGYDGKPITGSKTIKVTVKKKVVVIKTMKITNFEVIGYDIGFSADKREYTIDINPDVNKVYVLVEGSDFTATGNKVVNIKDKDFFEVSLKDDKETRKYKININRLENTKKEEVPEEKPEEEKPTIPVSFKSNDIFKYICIGLGILCFILILLLLASRKKEEKKELKALEKDYKRMPDFIEEAKKEPLPDGAIPPQKVEVTPIEEVPVKPLPTRPEPAKEDLPRREITYDKPTHIGSVGGAKIEQRPETESRVSPQRPVTPRPVAPRPVGTELPRRMANPIKKEGLDVPDFVAFSDETPPTYTGISLGKDEIVKIDDNN